MWKTLCSRNVKKSSESGVPSQELKRTRNQEGVPGCVLRAASREPSTVLKRWGKSFCRFSLLTVCSIVLLASLSACSVTYQAYTRGMFNGQRALEKGDYESARRNFEEAYQNEKDPVLLTYMAVVNYKMNNIADAERLIREAEWRGANDIYYLRTVGYKALILLKQDKAEGMDALSQYIALYALHDPLMTIDDVDAMRKSGTIDMSRLEKLIEDQVSWYEGEIQQYLSSGTGFYDGKYSGVGPIGRRGGVFFGR